MQYKTKKKPKGIESDINNMITTVNLKIKDINILLDDISTKNKDNIKCKSHKSIKIYNKNKAKLSSFSTINKNKTFFHKRNINTLKNSHKSMRTIPLNLKGSINSTNNTGSLPSFSNTIDIYKNLSNTNTDRIIYSKKRNNRKNCFYNNKNNSLGRNLNKEIYKIKNFHSETTKSLNRKIYIKKTNNKRILYRNIRSSNIKPFVLNSSSPKNFINNNLVLDNNNFSKNNFLNPELDGICSNMNKNNIKTKKIIFNFNISDKKYKNKKQKNINNDKNNNLLHLKSCLIIQNWWKNIKRISILKYYVIILQKVVRGYLLRKRIGSIIINSENFKDNNNIIQKISKNNNICKYYYISKCYYRNILPNITLLQREIKKFLIKLNIHNYYNNLRKEDNYILSFLIQKPKINICYITKFINKSNTKRISFINKKIKDILNSQNCKKIQIDKDDNKIILINKSLNDSSNSFISNITRNYNFHNNMITIQTIDSKESQDIFRFDIFNKNVINKNNKTIYFLRNLFKNNIIHKLYLIFLKMKYNYINFGNFINAICKCYIKYKKRIFIEYLNIYNNKNNNNYKKRKNFMNIILRHINIFKKNNNIKNEVIELIEKNLPENININQISSNNQYMLLNISLKQEENLLNSQIFQNNDNNLINYICLFFKYEKNKNNINYNFVYNRLIKEPLKFRNIFTVVRYIDSLDDKINNNKICMKCFCKRNEKKCKLNCNCHYIQNIVNENYFNNLIPKMKSRKGSLKKYNINRNEYNEHIFKFEKINKKILFDKNSEENNSDEFQDNENMNTSNFSRDKNINEIRINKAFTYFAK